MRQTNTLVLEQKEDVRHGDIIFPVQKYYSTISSTLPYITPHWHEEAELTLLLYGTCTYHLNQEDFTVEAGDLIFIPPAILHSAFQDAESSMHSETYVFHLNFLGSHSTDICSMKYLVPLLNQEYTVPSIIKKSHPAYPSLLEMFQQISSLYMTRPPAYELALKSWFLQVIFLLLPYGQKQDGLTPGAHCANPEKTKLVLNYMETNYAKPLTIRELASLCYFSEYHFMRFFKKSTGMTCLEYLNNLRLEKAVQCMEQGSSSVLEVSLSVGFGNLSYFHRAFKKKYGMTPKTFMKHLSSS